MAGKFCILLAVAITVTGCGQTPGNTTQGEHEQVAGPPHGSSVLAEESLAQPLATFFDGAITGAHPGGQELYFSTLAYLRDHGAFPSSLDLLRPYFPCNAMPGSFTLHLGQNPEGQPVLLAEQVINPQEVSAALAAHRGASYTPQDFHDIIPPPGVHGGIARYVIWIGDPAERDNFREEHWMQFTGQLMTGGEVWGVAATELQERTGKPVAGMPNAKLGLFVMLLEQAYNDVSLLGTSPTSFLRSGQPVPPEEITPPATLHELAAHYGGLNPEAWINPYTGGPLVAVAWEERRPGTYTDASTERGMRLLFHYLDEDGEVSSRIVGVR